MARTKVTVRKSDMRLVCDAEDKTGTKLLTTDSEGIERCGGCGLPEEDCYSMVQKQKKEEREAEIKDRKRKRLDFAVIINELGESNRAKMSGHKKPKTPYPKTCFICGYHTASITKEGDKFYIMSHKLDKSPFDCCSFCHSKLDTDYKTLRISNELITD